MVRAFHQLGQAMCFSAEADLIVGVVVTGAGVDALRHVRHKREVGLAALPLVFGAHQMIETFTWWGLEGSVPASVEQVSTWLYLFIAFLLPVLVPLALLSIEPDPGRRRAIVPFVVLGAAVSAVILAELTAGPVTARIAGRYISYDAHLGYGGPLTALYVAATCGPLLLSSSRRMVIFGALNLGAVAVLAWLMATGVISLWCAWAAVASLVIVAHLRTRPRSVDRPVAAAA
jgi:hypothetical protein